MSGCFHCGELWFHQLKCPANFPLSQIRRPVGDSPYAKIEEDPTPAMVATLKAFNEVKAPQPLTAYYVRYKRNPINPLRPIPILIPKSLNMDED